MDSYRKVPGRVERIFYQRGRMGESLEARRHRFSREVEIKCNDVWAHADRTHWGDFTKDQSND